VRGTAHCPKKGRSEGEKQGKEIGRFKAGKTKSHLPSLAAARETSTKRQKQGRKAEGLAGFSGKKKASERGGEH